MNKSLFFQTVKRQTPNKFICSQCTPFWRQKSLAACVTAYVERRSPSTQSRKVAEFPTSLTA